jgi:hypothetical protein
MFILNRDSLTSSLPICIPFISSSCLIALPRISKTMLKRQGESEHPCLVPDFREMVSVFHPLSMMLAIGLSFIAFIMFQYLPSLGRFTELLS